jgi:hypothetical protein
MLGYTNNQLLGYFSFKAWQGWAILFSDTPIISCPLKEKSIRYPLR